MINITNMIFFILLILSSLFSISSNSWISCWMGLEINLLSFIPLLYLNNLSSESMIKYFIIQAMSSSLLLFSLIFMMIKYNYMMTLILNLSIFMKLGSAPFHYWYIQIIKIMNWMNCFILFTWQKIAPLVLISYNLNTKMMYSFVLINIIMGSIEGLNQISLKSIMNFSSINHLGWMITLIFLNENLWMMYFMFYSMISLILIIMFNMLNISFLNQLYFLKNNFLNLFNIIINLLSLGGLPPLLGFFPKWISIQFMMINNQLFLLFSMMMTSLITLYFYLRTSISVLILINFKTKWINLINNNIMNLIMFFNSFISIMLLLLISFMMF
uniref:NADH dehydrogenase subunit 2 n=1 Tax=Dolophilodes bellatulus TaxID=2682779 RepID=UPI0022DCE1C0|nr:NADH dehydrogenase subunit 2 [Dolophilodes bellatulus]UZZ43883.1 NADH dehydrogenase subunit 2 [Dolophilodes bellatulus]